MTLLQEVTAQLCYFTAGVSLLYFLQLLFLKQWEVYDRPLAFLYLNNSLFYFGFGFLADGIGYENVRWVLTIPPSIILMGPAHLLFYLAVGNRPPRKRAYLHFLPGLILISMHVAMGFHPEPGQLLGTILTDPLGTPWSITVLIAATHAAGYFVYIIFRILLPTLRSTAPGSGHKKAVFMMTVTMAMAIFSVGGILAGYLLRLDSLMHISLLWTCLAAIVLFTGVNIRNGLVHPLMVEYQRSRYERSRLKGMDRKLLSNRLEELMITNRLFLDPDLTLEKTAEELKVSSPQLTQFLGEEIGSDFRNYVNRYRVEEVKRLLKTEPNAALQRISLLAGFNSKTAFNRAFKKHTGLSPSEFRNRF